MLFSPLAQASANILPARLVMEASMDAQVMANISAPAPAATIALGETCENHCTRVSGTDRACLSHCLQFCTTALALVSENNALNRHRASAVPALFDQKALLARSWFDPPPPRL
jgi:hypothetical protein